MITLDLDITYLSSRYHIAMSDIHKYQKSNMSIEEIMKIEAENGNSAAANKLMHITSNPDELARLFQLVNPQNRYLILSHMNRDDLLMIMQYLDPEEMILGLSIFNQDVLVELMLRMEPETLSKLVLSIMDTDKFLKIVPEEYLNQFLMSDKINRDMIMQAMAGVEEEQLQKMMEAYTGQSCYDSKDDILNTVQNLPNNEFMKMSLSMEKEGKQQLISGILRKSPELFKEFSPEAMVFPFSKMAKEDILKSFTVLETKEMLPMVERMPNNILSLITTQIDPEMFSKILCSDFADIIAKCGLKL